MTETTIKIPSFKDIKEQYKEQEEKKEDQKLPAAWVRKVAQQAAKKIEEEFGGTVEARVITSSMYPSQETQDELDKMDQPKRKRGRPRKNQELKVEDGSDSVVDEDLKTDLKSLVKALKPFRGSPKNDLNGLGLTMIPNRTGEGNTAFIYANNGKVGAIAYVPEETTLEDVAKYSILNSSSESSAQTVLMPPAAEELVLVQLSASTAKLGKHDATEGYAITFTVDSPGYKGNDPESDTQAVSFDFKNFQIWAEDLPLEEIDSYAHYVEGRGNVFYRETTWGGWAVLAELKAQKPEDNKEVYTGPKPDIEVPATEA